jgi:hypothetical protein
MEGAQCLPIKFLGTTATTYAVEAIAFFAQKEALCDTNITTYWCAILVS